MKKIQVNMKPFLKDLSPSMILQLLKNLLLEGILIPENSIALGTNI
jgi:hypothetical protein